jgi:hypothetical protein
VGLSVSQAKADSTVTCATASSQILAYSTSMIVLQSHSTNKWRGAKLMPGIRLYGSVLSKMQGLFFIFREMYCTNLWFKNLKRRDHLEDLGVDGRKILKSVLKKQGECVWTGFIWLRI